MILAGDIGGTHARLALFDAKKKKPIAHETFESGKFASLEAVLAAFLSKTQAKRVRAATFGLAGPVIDQRCVATNLPWVVDARAVARKTGIKQVTLLNDLVALAFGALTVPSSKLRLLQGKSPPKKTGGNLACIAAGTGLGEAALLWDGKTHVPLATEGGHVDFAARTPLEWELHGWLAARFGHVSYERIVAGPGFSALYEFFRVAKGVAETRANADQIAGAKDRNAIIAELGAAKKSEPAAKAVELFARVYGAEAGNLALKTLATGGVFVAGGIAGRFADVLARGEFMEAFLDKGRFRSLLETIPVAIVLDSDIGLAGSRFHAATQSR
jgi:glucokinase